MDRCSEHHKRLQRIVHHFSHAGTVLRVHESCSLEAVGRMGKSGSHNESLNDRSVVR